MSFTHLKNFRDFSGYHKKDGTSMRGNAFARSENPACLDNEEIVTLKKRGLLLDIDLRRDNELLAEADCLCFDDDISYCHIVMNDEVYASFGEVIEAQGIASAYYRSLTVSAERICAIFRLMSKAQCGVLFHCASGKDRTGTIAALLLLLCGICDEDIIEDYRLSYDRMYVNGAEELLSDPTLVPTAEVMEVFLKMFHLDYSSADDYFLKIGLSQRELDAIKAKA